MKETNMEHFRSEIEAILNKEEVIAISKLDGSVFACNEDECHRCICMDSRDNDIIPCDVTLMRWLMSEYKEEPVLTAREKHFVEFAETGWIARTEDGILMWHQDKPHKSNIMWRCDANWFNIYGFGHTFSFITWEDESPWSIEELRKLKVE